MKIFPQRRKDAKEDAKKDQHGLCVFLCAFAGKISVATEVSHEN